MTKQCMDCGKEADIRLSWDNMGNESWMCKKCFEDNFKMVKCSDGQYRTMKELKEMGLWER